MNKVVARMVDGSMIKGTTTDFFPGKEIFHISPANAPIGAKPAEIRTNKLKAVFFVKDYAGNAAHVKRNDFDPAQRYMGRRMKVVFVDGEVLVGTTTGYEQGRPGFFIIPADVNSNNERCYVVRAATKEISFLPQ